MAERLSRLDTQRKRLGNDQRWFNGDKGKLREITLEGSYIQEESAKERVHKRTLLHSTLQIIRIKGPVTG